MRSNRHKYLFALLLAMALLTPALDAQQLERCGTMSCLACLQAEDPGMAARMAAIESHTQAVVSSGQRAGSTVIRIPVVIHVVWNTQQQNLSNTQLLSQIDVLNEDFRRLNADAVNTPASFASVAADCELEFCLATVDPQGNPTTGITRTQSSVSSFSQTANNVKFTSQGGRDAWPRDQYLNIWVAPLASTLLGYAQFPGGPATTDGVVCTSFAFGRVGTLQQGSDRGRTTTHEVGHWLNLRHVWGDGPCGVDDFVADTPTADGPNYGCQVGVVSCSSVDMVQNYMDYSNDSCMNLFTQGQKARMRALFAPGGFREPLLSSPGCGTTTPPNPPGQANYQVNQPRSSLTLDGVVGTSSMAAVTTVSAGVATTVTLSSTLLNAPFDLVLAVSSLAVPGQGGFVTPGGQVVNVNLLDPTLFWGNSGTSTPRFLPFPGGFSAPLSAGSPVTASLQQVVIDPTGADGFALSQGCQLQVTAAVSPVFPVGPTGDDDSVTVDLVGSGYDYSMPFYGTTYSQLHVSSNGRVLFGAPSSSFSPSVSAALSGNPFVGLWTDLDPSLSGNITISSPGMSRVRIDWNGVPYWGEPTAPVTLGLEFDSASGEVTLDSLLQVPINPRNNSPYSGQNQFLGLSRGGPNAIDLGTSAFAPNFVGTGPANAMLYDFLNAAGPGGLAPTLFTGLDQLRFVPAAGGGYAWVGN